MNRAHPAWGLVILTLVVSAAVGAQRTPLDSLADETARLGARYADRRTAMGDGYRRIGAEFPGMGEHWLNPAELLANRVDASRPTMLSYATIAGRPTLVGFGFVVTTEHEALPDTTPGWPEAWHEHSGLLSDESGARVGRVGASASTTRVWVLHVWSPLENPEGRYRPDNWALPFARESLAAPALLDADVGRAFSLVGGGDKYLRSLLSDAGLWASGGAGATEAAIADARARASRVLERARAAGGVHDPDVAELRETWRQLGERLRVHLGAAVDPILAPPHRAAGDADHSAHRPPPPT